MTDVGGKEEIERFQRQGDLYRFVATWCGPCIQESPAFTALSEKYPDIEFLQISRDEQKEAWKSYIAHKDSPLTQYNSVDMELVEGWQLFYIPRFILVDKELKIIDAYAPRPSSTEIVTLLDSLSSKV
ncbi:MAG: TlpA family protein disulfide reductase [Odoribacter splanchnicus]